MLADSSGSCVCEVVTNDDDKSDLGVCSHLTYHAIIQVSHIILCDRIF